MWYSASFVLLCIASVIQGLTFRGSKEQPYVSTFQNLKHPYIGFEMDPIYYPVMSTLGLYRVSVDILQKDARDVSFAAVYYDACIKLYINTNGIAFAKGFNGLTRRYATTPLSGNPDGFSFIGVDRFKDVYGGTLYTTLTDNKTFFFTAVCMVNGEMSWGVESTSPTLPEETKKKIFDHAVSLGFNREDFTELKYDTCKN